MSTSPHDSPIERSARSLVGNLVVAGVVGLGFLCVIPLIFRTRQEARIYQVTNNLQQIGLAVHNYHSTNECLPAAFRADDYGGKGTSWRLIILPFMESTTLYNDYNLNLAWDSPANTTVSGTPAGFYARPEAPGRRTTKAELLCVVGAETAFPGPVGLRFDEVRDGQTETILVGEVGESTTRWTEPRDLTFLDMDFRVNGTAKSRSFGSPYGGARVLMVDGSCRTLADTTSPTTLRALLTVDGGEGEPR